MPISAPDVMQPAFRHARDQLLRPFRFGQWVRLAFVGLLAGEMSSFGGCNFSFPSNTGHQGTPPGVPSSAPLTAHSAPFIALALATIVVVFGLVILFTYIGSVMRFILFDSIIARECHVRQGWARRKGPGFRLFLWRLLVMLAMLASLLIVIGIPVGCAAALGWFAHAGDHLLGLVLGGLALFLIFAVLLVLFGVVNVMTKDFVVPQMALENISAIEGWRRLLPWLKYEKGGYAGYIGMKIVLAIGAAIASMIVTLIAIFVLLIPIGAIGVVAVLGGEAAGWNWNTYTIALAVIYGCIALAIFIFMAALISVPIVVFFPAYSIYFFAPRYPRLALSLWPEPPAPVAPDLPSSEPSPS